MYVHTYIVVIGVIIASSLIPSRLSGVAHELPDEPGELPLHGDPRHPQAAGRRRVM